jgi:hypothetical protein
LKQSDIIDSQTIREEKPRALLSKIKEIKLKRKNPSNDQGSRTPKPFSIDRPDQQRKERSRETTPTRCTFGSSHAQY